MSWYSLSVHGKLRWDSQSYISGIFTGQIIAGIAYHRLVENNCLHKRIRSTVSSCVSSFVAPKLAPTSREITATILEHAMQKQKLKYVASRVFEHMWQFTVKDFFNYSKNGFCSFAESVRGYWSRTDDAKGEKVKEVAPTEPKAGKLVKMFGWIKANYKSKEAEIIFNLIKGGRFFDAAQAMTIFSLRPVCENAVHASMTALVKTSTDKAYDFAIKKSFSIVAMPLLYFIGIKVLEFGAQVYTGDDNALDSLNASAEYIPSTSTVLTATAAAHALDVASAVWSAIKMPRERKDVDKEEIKILALKLAKEPIARKLKENSMLCFYGIANDSERVDAIVKTLINEIIDFYWEDLHKTKVLGLPLVS
jgi:hypothetical protein